MWSSLPGDGGGGLLVQMRADVGTGISITLYLHDRYKYSAHRFYTCAFV